jgi:hypothetical protein
VPARHGGASVSRASRTCAAEAQKQRALATPCLPWTTGHRPWAHGGGGGWRRAAVHMPSIQRPGTGQRERRRRGTGPAARRVVESSKGASASLLAPGGRVTSSGQAHGRPSGQRRHARAHGRRGGRTSLTRSHLSPDPPRTTTASSTTPPSDSPRGMRPCRDMSPASVPAASSAVCGRRACGVCSRRPLASL